MGRPRPDFAGRWSLSARRAWIEIHSQIPAPRPCRRVALRKESVDRNCDLGWPCQLCAGVALRKESVDRNFSFSFIAASRFSSLSARRAWIEIKVQPQTGQRNRRRSPQGEHGMFLFLTVQGGFVHADIRFNFKNCYSKKLSHKII